MITKSDIELTDFTPDEFMPHLSELKIYIRGTTEEVHNVYNNFVKFYGTKEES